MLWTEVAPGSQSHEGHRQSRSTVAVGGRYGTNGGAVARDATAQKTTKTGEESRKAESRAEVKVKLSP